MVSIIIPVHNSGKYLEKLFQSLVNQTYKNPEIILIDDASSDNSKQLYLNLTYFEYPTVIHIFGSETKYDDLLYTWALFFRKVKIPESNLLIAEIDYNRSKENR